MTLFERMLCWLTNLPEPPLWTREPPRPPDPPYGDEDLKAQHERNAWGKAHGIS